MTRPARHCGRAAAASLEARLCVVNVCRGAVQGLQAVFAALAAQMAAAGGLYSGSAVVSGP